MKILSLLILVLFHFFNPFACYADQFSSSPFNVINDIAVEGDLLWCATNGGVIQWNTQTGNYITYTTADGVYGDSQRFVEVDQNGVKWFGSNNGVLTFDGESWKTVMDFIISDIFVDSENVVWIMSSGLLTKIDADTMHEISRELYINMNVYGLKCCVEAENGIMWFGSSNGVFRFDGSSWTNYTFDDIWAHSVFDIAVDDDGTVWIVTNGGGILSYDMVEWTTYTE